MRLETASERNEVKIMALKKLNQFNYFDAEGFFSKLKLITVGSTVWKEYGSNVVKGTKLDNIDILEKIYRGKSNIENEVLAATYNSVANIYIERKDYVNAFCYLKKAAKCKSSTRAINNLGWMYLYGYGCEQDVSQAINIFLYAANSEIKPDKLANRHLGKLYLGVHPAISNEEIIDFEKALYYLERAKQLGADDVDKLIEKAKNMLNDK